MGTRTFSRPVFINYCVMCLHCKYVRYESYYAGFYFVDRNDIKHNKKKEIVY